MQLFKVTSLTECKWAPDCLIREQQLTSDSCYRHVDLKGNLIKAMMVMNWLNMLEVENF